jgi:hypothetical protein
MNILMMTSELLSSTELQWAEIQLLLIELAGNATVYLVGAGTILAPVLINWIVRKLLDRLGGQAAAITQVNGNVNHLAEAFEAQAKQLENTQRLMVAMISMSGLASEKKTQLLEMIEKSVSVPEMLAKAKELNITQDAATQQLKAEATSLLTNLAKELNIVKED